MADGQNTQQPGVSPAMDGMAAAAQYFANMQANIGRNPQQQPTPTAGTTQMGPSLKPAAQPKQTTQFKAGGLPALVIGLVNKIQQRKKREDAQVFDRFTSSVAGLQDGQAQLKQAQQDASAAAAKLRENPKDPDALKAYQDAASRIQQTQSSMQINKTNLDDMFNGPKGEKHAKMLAKGFGIDDKNADTPERQLAIASVKKQLGVGDKAASILSRVPQTMQPTTQAKEQQMAQQTGVVGKPATQGQLLTHADNAAKLAQTGQFKTIAAFQNAEKIANAAGENTDKMVTRLPELGLQAVRDADNNVERNPDGTLKVRNLTPEELENNPVLAQKYQETQAKIALQTSQVQANQVRAKVSMMREQRMQQQQAQAKDPTAVSLWAKQVSDPSSGVTMATVPMAARGAVLQAVAAQGGKLAKPLDADELKRADLGGVAYDNLADAKNILKNRPDMFGPGGWGKTKFEMALAGGDPDAVQFQADITLANLPLIGIHGVRGQWAAADLDKLDSNLYLNKDAMGRVLDEASGSAKRIHENPRYKIQSDDSDSGPITVTPEEMK
jgi:hypothetical protein